MRENLVSLNVNPCKMCMPMGSVSAFYGIARCMTLLHGSQGCSTYIRRHMATHYNEPVDIASSSLTEHGAVFGGEDNLIKGLENLMTLYRPEVIGVATTCLAETIGEDIPRIVRDFYESHPDCATKIITVSSGGYSGTQYEGFFAALRAIVSQTEMDNTPNGCVNVVTGMLSPADTRWLRGLAAMMGVDMLLLPDLSETLDGGHEADYDRLPRGGTPLSEVRRMAGARVTIELSEFVSAASSPGLYLQEAYGVPCVRLPLPVGLAGTDALIRALADAGGIITPELEKERSRYLDAMIDSHKYNAHGRAAVYGEPDFVAAVCRLCAENGIVPVVAAAGARSEALKERLREIAAPAAELAFEKPPIIADDTDFDSIEAWVKESGANVLIGNSDGRRIAGRLGLPLVRCAFPIHDQVGGQRVRTLGYEGSIALLDQITNVLLLKLETGYRAEMYDNYYRGPKKEEPKQMTDTVLTDAAARSASHPCFNGCGGKFARIHLPIAPACNIQCNYCVRKFDCVNESRPGVTSEVLNPQAAAQRYFDMKAKVPNLTVIGIAGPGDALANFNETKQTLKLIRERDPDVTFCLSTNGLMLPRYADELARLRVTHVTVTLNAVDPAIGAQIYKHIHYMGQTYTGLEAAAILLSNQLMGIRMMAERGAVVKVNIVMIRGINDAHIPAVVEKAKSLGVSLTNIMQLIPVEGSAFEHTPMVPHKEIMAMRGQCEAILPQMLHCKQCRADAVGTLGNDVDLASACEGCGTGSAAAAIPAPSAGAPAAAAVPNRRFAVSSKSGVLVDQHFGQATDFYIYEQTADGIRFRERRGVGGGGYCSGPADCSGGAKPGKEDADGRMERILGAIADCDCIVTLRIGAAPRTKLEAQGKCVHTGFGPIESVIGEAAQAAC